MIQRIFSIFDVASGAYMRPFYTVTQGQAKRAFMDCATDPNHEIGRHPKDYTLFEIGSFDDITGSVQDLECNEAVMNGLEAIAASRTYEDMPRPATPEEASGLANAASPD